MSRLKELFDRKSSRILNVYCTAGFPEIESGLEVMRALQVAGVDIIELGMPYSDPLADGPVIQASAAKALANGMTISRLFEQLKNFRSEINLPVVLMGYLNPVLQFGFEKFCDAAAAVGIDGLIIPDMPLREYENEYKNIVERSNLDMIFLVTPQTTEERIMKLDALSSGFLYAVSSSSVTGAAKDFSGISNYLEKLKGLTLKNPILVGFGVGDKNSFDIACTHANGAIIGTAYIKAIEEGKSISETTKRFVNGIIGKMESIEI